MQYLDPSLRQTRKAEIRNLLSNFYLSTRSPLVEIDQKSRNQKSTFQLVLIDQTTPCRNRPEKQKSEIYYPISTHRQDHPLQKSTRKAEIRNLLSNFYSSTRPPLLEIDQKSRNQESTFQLVLIDQTTPCRNRPEKQKSEIYFPTCTHRLDHPLQKSTRKAEIRKLVFNLC